MCKAIIFGGTAEGRKLYEHCDVLYCVATQVGRLDGAEMIDLISQHSPELVIDATHPYAKDATRHISAACDVTGTKYLRVARERGGYQGIDQGEAVTYLSQTDGNIFAATGLSGAKLLLPLKDRVFLRILPIAENLRHCLDLGYDPRHMICMYPPFTKEMNIAMFQAVNASVLVTKDGGKEGGFHEKIEAAKTLGMEIVVLRREEENGVTVEEAIRRIETL